MEEQGGQHEVQYRYEYRFDVHDTAGSFVDTVSFQTLAEFVGLVPVMFQLAGMDVPSQNVIDAFVSEVSLVWVDPAVDWAFYN